MKKPFMDKVIDELKSNVVGECSHQLKKDNAPYCATMVYFFSESHLFIHNFADEGKLNRPLPAAQRPAARPQPE